MSVPDRAATAVRARVEEALRLGRAPGPGRAKGVAMDSGAVRRRLVQAARLRDLGLALARTAKR